jgi:hypothetical protein
MIAKHTGKKINIFPHIGEAGYESGSIAISKEKQFEIYKEKKSNIIYPALYIFIL